MGLTEDVNMPLAIRAGASQLHPAFGLDAFNTSKGRKGRVADAEYQQKGEL